jgi:hypothetical protein
MILRLANGGTIMRTDKFPPGGEIIETTPDRSQSLKKNTVFMGGFTICVRKPGRVGFYRRRGLPAPAGCFGKKTGY